MKKALIPILAIALFAGCYPSSPTYTQTYDLAVTNYDPAFNFNGKQTFSIPDNVIRITGSAISDPDGNNLPDFISEPTNSQILNAIKSNMTANGWTEVASTDSPDVIILPSAMESTT